MRMISLLLLLIVGCVDQGSFVVTDEHEVNPPDVVVADDLVTPSVSHCQCGCGKPAGECKCGMAARGCEKQVLQQSLLAVNALKQNLEAGKFVEPKAKRNAQLVLSSPAISAMKSRADVLGVSARKKIVIFAPAWCSACKAMRASFAAAGFEFGDADIEIEWRDAEFVYADAYPYALDETTNRYAVRRKDGKQWTINDLRVLAGFPPR